MNPSEWPAQVAHKFNLPSTIDPDHTRISELNTEIEESWNGVRKYHKGDEMMAGEIAFIGREIAERIEYCTDMENPNYKAFEHFPTVSQVLENKKDDCDGRAIVACSLLIHRGYNSYVIMNERHAWVITYFEDGSFVEILKNPIPDDDHNWLLQWNDHTVKVNFTHPVSLVVSLFVVLGITSTRVFSLKKIKPSFA
jgi:hypothetical protein